MKYRFFLTDPEEVKQQFISNYNKSLILLATKQEEFETCILKINLFDWNKKIIILDSFLLLDILTEDNICKLKEIEDKLEYIVFCGSSIDLEKIILKLNGKLNKKLKNKFN